MASYFVSNSSFEFSLDVKVNGSCCGQTTELDVPEDMETERFISVWCPDVKIEIVTKTGVGTMTGKPLKYEVEAKCV